MSEHTTQNNQEPIICFGNMNCDVEGNTRIKYYGKISFQGKDCMVIPLEGIDKSKAKKGNKTNTEKGDR